MRTSIVIIIFGLILSGCGNSAYISLTENNRYKVEEQLRYNEKDEDVGVEITLSLANGTEIDGELLSVRDTTIIVCSEYGVPENQLARIINPIYSIHNDEIQKLSIERGPYVGDVFVGAGLGLLGGAIAGGLIGIASMSRHSFGGEVAVYAGVGALAGLITGVIMGATSYDDIILQDIPADYDFSLLKPLARYPDEEPEYLGAIK